MTDFQKLLKIACIVDEIAPYVSLKKVEILNEGKDMYSRIRIHITTSMDMSEVADIGREFGDDNPNICASEYEDYFCISIVNISHDDEFKTKHEIISMEFYADI